VVNFKGNFGLKIADFGPLEADKPWADIGRFDVKGLFNI